MPYLNLDPNYFEHHKTRRLVALLGPYTDVLPLRLWAYCAKFHPLDGRLRGYSAEEIGTIIGVVGDPKPALAALAKVGFISANSGGYACVDWGEHQGHLMAFSRRGKAAAKARWKQYAERNASSMPTHSLRNAPAVPIRTVPDQQQITAANGTPSAADLSKLADSKHVKHALKKSDADLLKTQLPFSFGDIPRGRQVIDIDPVSAKKIMDTHDNLGLNLRCALLARIKLKESESIQ